jgi:hypothetical protein
MSILKTSYANNNENKTVIYETEDADTVNIVLTHFGDSGDNIDSKVRVYIVSGDEEPVDHIGGGGDKLIGYLSEDVYLHGDTSVNRCFLYDTQRTSKIDVVSNESPNVMKTFESIAVHSNKKWDIDTITIPSNETYPSGMQSKIPSGRFVRREGVYYAEYLRNMFSNSSTANTLDLLRGDPLRGYVIEHRLENEDTDEANLFKVDVNSSPSSL